MKEPELFTLIRNLLGHTDQEIAREILYKGHIVTVDASLKEVRRFWECEQKRIEEDSLKLQADASKHIEELNKLIIKGENNTYNRCQTDAKQRQI